MKRIIFLLFCLLVMPGAALANSVEHLSVDEQRVMLGATDWQSLGTKTNVSLDKMWTINFSNRFTYDDIAAVSITTQGIFIPITVGKVGDNQLTVKPRDSFAGNTNYSLRIVLENGKKYKMDFTTVAAIREADQEPNNTISQSSPLWLNEQISGKVTINDTDYYKVTVLQDGELRLDLTSLDGTPLDITLYGEAYQQGHMKFSFNKSQHALTTGLLPGVYYIKITPSSAGLYSDYTLKTTFTPSKTGADLGGVVGITNAPQIALNTQQGGTIGHMKSAQNGNGVDYFKVVIPSDGKLRVDLTSLDGTPLDILLYGEAYQQGYIKSGFNESQHAFTTGLLPGVYYIKITPSSARLYSDYTLKTTFTPSKTGADLGGVVGIINAPQIALNTQQGGTIGHMKSAQNGNGVDYFKVIVHQKGNLRIDVTSMDNVNLNVALYGEAYQTGVLTSSWSKTQTTLIKDLTPGIYYIQITTPSNQSYSDYTLKTTFN